MKRQRSIGAAIVFVLLAAVSNATWADPGHHHRGGARVGIGFSVGPVWAWDPWWPYPFGYPRYMFPPTVVVAPAPEPPVYIEKAQEEAAGNYWYYCAKAGGYYPTVKTCPEGWIKVPPQ